MSKYIIGSSALCLTIGAVTVSVSEYSAERSCELRAAPTVSGGRVYYSSGVNPCHLHIVGCVPESNPTVLLESYLRTGGNFSGTLDGLSFSGMRLERYSVRKKSGGAVYACELELKSITAGGGISNAE